jgi:hypothetical protein
MNRLKRFVIFFMMLMSSFVPAEDFNEDDYFSDEDVIVEKDEIMDESTGEEMEKESVGFTGEIGSSFTYSMTQDFFQGDQGIEGNPFGVQMNGDFLLDVRLMKGIKACADMGVIYLPQGETIMYPVFDSMIPFNITGYLYENLDTLIRLKEFFIDVNIARLVYIRVGKQVLQWGTGYFWNPTDVINIERKNFFDMDALREGVYGLKLHIPFGTVVNLYGFLDPGHGEVLTDVAVAGKAEFLFFATEISFSAWAKDRYVPVFGMDLTSRLFDIDLRGEISISYGDNRHKIDTDGHDIDMSKKFMMRCMAGFTLFFDLFDVEDRLSIDGEFYYNHNGYDENMPEDESFRSDFLDRYYVPNSYGRYYGALFVTVNKFIVSDLVLALNALGNFSDLSFLVSTGLLWNPVHNFTAGCTIHSAIGEDNREYTFSGNRAVIELSLGIRF